jgi:hypothetical protein
LIIIIFINPFLDESTLGRLFSSLLVVLSTVGALMVMFAHREIIWFILAIVLLSIVFEILAFSFNNDFFIGIKYLYTSIINTTFAFILFYYLMKVQPLSLSEIGNAISIYLLVGLAFGYFYCFWAQHHPTAFSNLDTASKKNEFDLIYYSFITLTTTGYGDIQPLEKLPRILSIFETVFGTFYIAIIIGRLVGVGLKKQDNSPGKY